MNKDLFRYILVFTSLFLIGFYTHSFLLNNAGYKLSFSLEKIYLFHAFFSGLICVNLRLASTVDKISSQIGFLYLWTLVIKLILFIVFFYKPLLTIESFSFTEKISLCIPLFVFLLTEVIFVAKILNEKE